jgi:co-chaperonin GroES (HSP10)
METPYPIPEFSKLENADLKFDQVLALRYPPETAIGSILLPDMSKKQKKGVAWIIKLGAKASEIFGSKLHEGSTIIFDEHDAEESPTVIGTDYLYLNAKDIILHYPITAEKE